MVTAHNNGPRYWTVVVVVLCAAAVGAASPPSHTLDGSPISVHPVTFRLVDEHFREVFFHGVNAVVKGFPWIPDGDAFSPGMSLSTADFEAMETLGLNCVRLGTMWPGLEHTRGVYNRSYSEAVARIVANGATHGVYTLLDMHQDVLQAKLCGEGFPDWAVVPSNNSQFPEPLGAPYIYSNGLPLPQECASKPWSAYYFTEATGSAFQNLYDNNFGLQDSWSDAWVAFASAVQDLGAAVLGYELMNEPWAGNAVADLTLMVPGVADRVNLQPMWDVGAAAIRAVDSDHAIFFEGVTWDWVGVGFTDVPGGSVWRNKSVLSYHFYIPPDFSVDVQFAARMDDMQRLQCGGFLTEAWDYDAAVLDKCDEVGQSWLLWEYKPFVHAKTGYASSIWFDNGTMNMAMASFLSRTYAKVVAGTTVTQRYDNRTQSYLLVFRGDALVTANTTKIYFNEALHYPNGATVVATTSQGAGYVTWRRSAANHIEVQHDLAAIGANGTVTVTIAAN